MTSFKASIAALSLSALTLAAAPAGAQALPKGDAAKGEKLFAQCKVCHSLEAGKNGVGPSLKGIVGSKAADVPGFSFSPAMQKSKLVWKPAVLSDFLTAPMKKVPGTKMPFAGLPKPQDRADIIAYLSKN
ncbi:MAG: cytochrome c family protein [Sphingobium sp.]|nr:cytochrome c family protein [Sphingobium sp.]